MQWKIFIKKITIHIQCMMKCIINITTNKHIALVRAEYKFDKFEYIYKYNKDFHFKINWSSIYIYYMIG